MLPNQALVGIVEWDRETGELMESAGKVREKETLTEEFWKPIFEQTDFKEYIKSSYQIGTTAPELEEENDNE